MKKHTKIYFDYFGYSPGEFIPSEISGSKAVDINHIDARGMGGSKNKDVIENLMAMTRDEHIKYGDKSQYKDFLKEVHREFMATQIPYIDRKFNETLRKTGVVAMCYIK